ncbi:Hypothetical_protein [Hexamita inflata]|uniref:Hypothetical_protein n=1 Tax=Hexamita inflata TaxID=28002 RepID=A0AA86PAV7_9EUKA|nr:Hypothetical protein HINF_LOCUS22738 [Hexamita inflata]
MSSPSISIEISSSSDNQLILSDSSASDPEICISISESSSDDQQRTEKQLVRKLLQVLKQSLEIVRKTKKLNNNQFNNLYQSTSDVQKELRNQNMELKQIKQISKVVKDIQNEQNSEKIIELLIQVSQLTDELLSCTKTNKVSNTNYNNKKQEIGHQTNAKTNNHVYKNKIHLQQNTILEKETSKTKVESNKKQQYKNQVLTELQKIEHQLQLPEAELAQEIQPILDALQAIPEVSTIQIELKSVKHQLVHILDQYVSKQEQYLKKLQEQQRSFIHLGQHEQIQQVTQEVRNIIQLLTNLTKIKTNDQLLYQISERPIKIVNMYHANVMQQNTCTNNHNNNQINQQQDQIVTDTSTIIGTLVSLTDTSIRDNQQNQDNSQIQNNNPPGLQQQINISSIQQQMMYIMSQNYIEYALFIKQQANDSTQIQEVIYKITNKVLLPAIIPIYESNSQQQNWYLVTLNKQIIIQNVHTVIKQYQNITYKILQLNQINND